MHAQCVSSSFLLISVCSELEDEEDEEDEDEDEEEEDEEEDEEDKEADSLYKDFDSDTELPGFTVPGITSQEPDVEAGSMALLEVATYQVPETMEWEQQNQGLGKSPLTNPFQRFHYLLLASVREKNNLLMVMYAFIGIFLGISSSLPITTLVTGCFGRISTF